MVPANHRQALARDAKELCHLGDPEHLGRGELLELGFEAILADGLCPDDGPVGEVYFYEGLLDDLGPFPERPIVAFVRDRTAQREARRGRAHDAVVGGEDLGEAVEAVVCRVDLSLRRRRGELDVHAPPGLCRHRSSSVVSFVGSSLRTCLPAGLWRSGGHRPPARRISASQFWNALGLRVGVVGILTAGFAGFGGITTGCFLPVAS